MGYLQAFDDRFEQDVFISYAHHDDDTFGKEPRGWVSQLHMDLTGRVTARHLGVANGFEPSLWRGSEIRTYEDFDAKILGRTGENGYLSFGHHSEFRGPRLVSQGTAKI